MTISNDDAPPGNATLRGGAFPSGTGWQSRRYIPHFNSGEVVQHVTFHLADSMPKDAVARMAEELERVDPEHRDIERRRRLENIIDAGYGSCLLRQPEIASLVQQSLLHFDAERYRMLAWVVMPNHVHALFQTVNGWSMPKIVASWKSWTAKHISQKRHHGGWRSQESTRVWHREYWDRFIRDERHYYNAVQYIHQNPVKAGLVTHPQDWPWSSASRSN